MATQLQILLMALLLGGGACAAAQETDPIVPEAGATWGDLRLIAGEEVGSVSQIHRQTTTPAAGGPSTTTSSTERTRLRSGVQVGLQQVDGLSSRGSDRGWIIGYDLELERVDWTAGSGGRSHQIAGTLSLLAGYAWPLARCVHLELTPLIGLGIARWDIADSSGALQSARSVLVSAGVRAAAVTTLRPGLQLLIEARIAGQQGRPSLSHADPVTGMGTEDHQRVRLLTESLLVGVGWHF